MGVQINVAVNYDDIKELIVHFPEFDGYVMDLLSEDIQQGAQRRAPVRTGLLRDSIYRAVSGGHFWVSSEAPYASFVEFGTTKMAAQPHLIPAVEAADYDGAIAESLARVGL